MKFKDVIVTYDTILVNGPLGTRLQYDFKFPLGTNMATFDLIKLKEGRAALTEIYRGDIDIAQSYNLPIIINAVTFRASRNHLRARGLCEEIDIKGLNIASINFIKDIRDSYGETSAPILISAPIGSMHDAYSVDPLMSCKTAREYHQEQIDIFEEGGVDLICAVTVSSYPEALGIAMAAQLNNIEYTIGFILTQDGTLLDGTPLHDAISALDNDVQKKPTGYFITCTHYKTMLKLSHNCIEYNRIIGVLANGSDFPPRTLASMTASVTDPPEQFTKGIGQLRERFTLKIIGGCCGTTKAHLNEVARLYGQKNEVKLQYSCCK